MDGSADATAQPSSSLFQQLKDGEKHWRWKMGLRATLIVLDLVGIGCLAWLTSRTLSARASSTSYYNPYINWFDYFFLPFALAILTLSLIWSLVAILVPLLRKSHRPVHPGTAVAFDLLLWLALIVTGLFTIAGLFSLEYFGQGGVIQDYSYGSGYSGQYELAKNGTWVYKITTVYSDPTYHFNQTTHNYTYSTPPVHRSCDGFRSCAAEDALVNRLWKEKAAREGTEITGAAVQWLGVLLHFTLFVWACVDTHRRNTRSKEGEMVQMTDRLLRDMQARGMITVHDPNLAARTTEGGVEQGRSVSATQHEAQMRTVLE